MKAYEKFQSCINASYECAAVCDHCATACLSEPDPASMAKCIRLAIDCADLCRLNAGFLARDSSELARISGFCAEICEACAAECEKFDHSHCQECAKACRLCVEECRRVGERIFGNG